MNEQRRQEFELMLEQPPAGMAAAEVDSDDSAWSPEAEMSTFLTAQRATSSLS